jgi:hypothetical protein
MAGSQCREPQTLFERIETMLAGFYWAICLDRDNGMPEIVCVEGVNGVTTGTNVFRFGDDIPWGLEHFRFISRIDEPTV